VINNYLDWAKRERKWYVKSYVAHGRKFREVKDDWCKGFHKGLTLAYMDAAYNFKRLQKDIEARLADPDQAVLPLANLILTHNIFK